MLAHFPERFVLFFAIFLFFFLYIFHNPFPLPDLSGSVDELDDSSEDTSVVSSSGLHAPRISFASHESSPSLDVDGSGAATTPDRLTLTNKVRKS